MSISVNEKPRVLIIDDDHYMLQLQKTRLMGHYEVIVANSIEVAIDICQQPFDIILMNIDIPEKHGKETAQAIRELISSNVNASVIGLTDYFDESIRTGCLKAGMNDVFLKPVPRTTLKKYVM